MGIQAMPLSHRRGIRLTPGLGGNLRSLRRQAILRPSDAVPVLLERARCLLRQFTHFGKKVVARAAGATVSPSEPSWRSAVGMDLAAVGAGNHVRLPTGSDIGSHDGDEHSIIYKIRDGVLWIVGLGFHFVLLVCTPNCRGVGVRSNVAFGITR
jgi:hypothetical protein